MDSPRVRRLQTQNAQEDRVLKTTLAKISIQSQSALGDLSRTQAKFERRYAEHLPPLVMDKHRLSSPGDSPGSSPRNSPRSSRLFELEHDDVYINSKSGFMSPRSQRRTKLSAISVPIENGDASAMRRRTLSNPEKKFHRSLSHLNGTAHEIGDLKAGVLKPHALLTRSKTLPPFCLAASLGNADRKASNLKRSKDNCKCGSRKDPRSVTFSEEVDVQKATLTTHCKTEEFPDKLDSKKETPQAESDPTENKKADLHGIPGKNEQRTYTKDNIKTSDDSSEKHNDKTITRESDSPETIISKIGKRERSWQTVVKEKNQEAFVSQSELNHKSIFGSSADEAATQFARRQATVKFQRVIKQVFERLREYKMDGDEERGAEKGADWDEIRECRYLRVREGMNNLES